MDETLGQIGAAGVIAIVRGDFGADALLSLGETLAGAGIRVLEITLNTPGALAAITQLRQRLGGGMLVGAGTVRTAAQWEAALDAGAQFTVAPNFDPATVVAALARGVLHLPGVFTPTEAEVAHRIGSPLLKLFPADLLGPGYLKALRAPLDDLRIVPTGGVTVENIAAYRRAGAFACGIGSALVAGPEQSPGEVQQRAQVLLRAWESGA